MSCSRSFPVQGTLPPVLAGGAAERWLVRGDLVPWSQPNKLSGRLRGGVHDMRIVHVEGVELVGVEQVHEVLTVLVAAPAYTEEDSLLMLLLRSAK